MPSELAGQKESVLRSSGVPKDDPRDKRRYDRFGCRVKITYTILSNANATPFEYGVTYSSDLSEGGARIYTDREVQVPILIQLNLAIPARPYNLLVLGKAVRCLKCPDTGLYELGIKFVGILPPNFKEFLKENLGVRDEQDAGRDGTAPAQAAADTAAGPSQQPPQEAPKAPPGKRSRKSSDKSGRKSS